MPSYPTLLAFAAASLALVASPGPNLIYILTRGAAQGRRAGVVSALGVETGTLVHVMAAAFGLAALVATADLAFTGLRLAGAAYLAYLGLRAFVRPTERDPSAAASARPLTRVYRDGVLVNVLNPKVALFFLAFLPQFTTPGADTATTRAQMLVLGVVFFVIALALDVAYAVAGAAVSGRLRRRPGGSAWTRYVIGGVYLGLGVYAALVGGHAARD
jgi:threonine/homoserine/homoserine lactone efflux protein